MSKFFFNRIIRSGIITTIFLFGGINLPAQETNDWLSLAFDYIEQNRLDSAEIALKTFMKNNPDNPLNPYLLNNLGTIQRRIGKLDEALISYTAALGTFPAKTDFLESRAALLAEMGKTGNAIIDYSTLLSENPNNEEALYQRGLLYMQIKINDLAEADFQRMLEINPNGLYARRGFASLAKIMGNYEEAEKIYHYLLDKEPDDFNLHAGRAELYLLMKKPGKALTDINRAIRLAGVDSKNPYLYITRYRIKLLLHEKESAQKDLTKAIELGYEGEEELKTKN